jgi:Ca-activated chloride channel family protein
VRSVTGDLDLEQIYVGGIKASLQEREIEAHRRQRWEDRFQWLLAIALAALMIDGLLPEASSARPARARAATGAAPRAAAAIMVVALLVAAAPRAHGQAESGESSESERTTPSPQAAEAGAGAGGAGTRPQRRFDRPEEAYEAGDYAQALDGFLELQVERPQDSAVMMNVGSSHYQLDDLEAAARSFEAAGAAGDDSLRAQAWYDLGNVAYRQNRFEEAIDAYHRSLDLDPDDADAKFNLEVAHTALVRQQQQQQQQQDQRQDQQQQQQQQQQGQQDQQRDEQEQDGSDSSQQQEQQQEPGEQDQREQQQEQQQQSGEQEAREQQAQAGPPREAGESALSPAEAQRLLESLEEGRPRRKVPPGRQRDQEKDW